MKAAPLTRRSVWHVCCTALIVCLLWPSAALAQANGEPVVVNGDQVEYLTERGEIRAEGEVSVHYGDVELYCDRITVRVEEKIAICEGHVRFLRGQSVLTGDQLTYNFTTGEGQLTDARVAAPPMYAVGDVVDARADGSYVLRDAFLTTCDLPDPHYRIRTREVAFYPDHRVETKGATVVAGKMPLFYLPKYSQRVHHRQHQWTVVPGRDGRWGAYVLTSYRLALSDHLTVQPRFDFREHFGPAEGLDVLYEHSTIGSGWARVYGVQEEDSRRASNESQQRDRYGVEWRHRLELDAYTVALAEYHRYSDDRFLRDFFLFDVSEYAQQPESRLSVVRNHPDYAASLFVRKRANHFDTVTEKLPEVRFNWRQHQLSDSQFYFTGDAGAAALTNTVAGSATDDDAGRADLSGRLTSRHEAGGVHVAPFVELNGAYYTKNLAGEEEQWRAAVQVGVDLSTKFYRVYDADGTFMGVPIHQLRHIITPTLSYLFVPEPNIDADELAQFDDIDELTEHSLVSLGLQNKFQTKRLVDGEWQSRDLGFLLVTADWDAAAPSLTRLTRVNGLLEFEPTDWLRMESDVRYELDPPEVETWNVDLFVHRNDWEVGFGSRYRKDTEHELTSQLAFPMGEKWWAKLLTRFDLKEVESGRKRINHLRRQEVTIGRDLHCWTVELTFSHDSADGDGIFVVFHLKAAPDVPNDLRDAYRPPSQSHTVTP